MKGLSLSTIRALCVLTCLLLPVLTWSESFLDLVRESDAATVQAAIDAGADLEARDEDGWTPLMYAAGSNESAAVVQQLMPGDVVSEGYLSRTKELIANPPGPDWDGATLMTEK